MDGPQAHADSETELARHSRGGISLVLPAYNEAECLSQAIDEADKALRSLTADYEIIVVDDGSRDDTHAIALAAAETSAAVRVVRHEQNRGYGAAIRSGFAAARMDLVVFTDSDCQFNLRELDRFVLLARDYDVVCGYRIDRQDTWLRRMYSLVYNLLVRCLLHTGVRDVDCALKMFRREALDKIRTQTNGFLINSEMLTAAHQHQLTVVEVGVTHRPRPRGTSTVSIRHIPVVLTALLRFWWNHVAFTTARVDPPESRQRSFLLPRWAPWAVFLVAGLLLFSNLSYPLIARDETRYAEIPREMVLSGNWLVPQLNFRPYFDKPPLFYWLCAASYQLFGISESSARIVPALAAFGLLGATYWFGRRHFGTSTAVLSTIVLLLSAGFLFCGRFLIIDMVLSLFTALSLFAAYESITCAAHRWRWWILSAVCCGLGVLTKGPVAGILLVMPAFAFAWLSGAQAALSRWHALSLMAIVAAIAGPWFIQISLRQPGFAYEFFVHHNLARFAGAYHQHPIWFFVPVLLVGGHPWSFLLVPCGWFLGSRATECRTQRPVLLGYLLLWAGWCILFFSLSKGKLPAYILPAAPALALVIGYTLDRIVLTNSSMPPAAMARRLSPWSAAITTCLAGATLSGVAYALELDSAQAAAFHAVLWCLAVAAVGFMGRVPVGTHWSWSISLGITLLLLTQVSQHWLPQFGSSQALLSASSPLADQLRISTDPIITFGDELSSVPFYARRNDVVNLLDGADLSQYLAVHSRAVVIVESVDHAAPVRQACPPNWEISQLADSQPVYLIAAPRTSIASRAATRPLPRK